MNNKGFTLIELLATIITIGIIMAIVFPSAYNMRKKNEVRKYHEYENMMVEYARLSDIKDQDTIDLYELEELTEIKNECTGYVNVDRSITPYGYKACVFCGDKYSTPDACDKSLIVDTTDLCKDCLFTFQYDMATVWNSFNYPPTILTSGLYTDYKKLIKKTGFNYFMGVKLDDSNRITKAYACGVRNNIAFCIEGTPDGSKFSDNRRIIEREGLWQNSCELKTGSYDNIEYTDYYCQIPGEEMTVVFSSDGFVSVAGILDEAHECRIGNDGALGCSPNNY